MPSSNGNIFRVTGHLCGEFTGDPQKKPATRCFDVFFDLRQNKRLSIESRGWWFETLSRPLWRHRNGEIIELLGGGGFTLTWIPVYVKVCIFLQINQPTFSFCRFR